MAESSRLASVPTSELTQSASSAQKLSAQSKALPAAPPDMPNAGSVESACRALSLAQFAPTISVIASPDADTTAAALKYESVAKLLQTLGSSVPGGIPVRDYRGTSRSLDDFSVSFCDPSVYFVSNGTQSSAITPATPDVSDSQLLQNLKTGTMNSTDTNLYTHFFRQLLSQTNRVTPFETFTHPVATLLVVSAQLDTRDAVETLAQLFKQSQQLPMLPFLSRDVMRCYVLIHDDRIHDLRKSEATFEALKRHFGMQCFMLRVRSEAVAETPQSETLQSAGKGEQPAPSKPENEITVNSVDTATATATPPDFASHPDPSISTLPTHLSSRSLRSVQSFVREVLTQTVIPYMERCVTLWTEQVVTPRRSITGRLFSVSKRWIGGSSSPSGSSKPSRATMESEFDPELGFYAPGSPEAVLRRLADFSFMLRDFRHANSVYELVARDFHNHKAWSHVAACQEMIGLSNLLMSVTSEYPQRFRRDTVDAALDSALYSYVSRCGLLPYAARCVLVLAETLLWADRRNPQLARPSAEPAVLTAVRWYRRAVDEDSIESRGLRNGFGGAGGAAEPKRSLLVGRVGYALVLERIGRCFESYAGRQKAALARMGLNAPGEPLLVGMSQNRKMLLWDLLAIRQWRRLGVADRSEWLKAQIRLKAEKDPRLKRLIADRRFEELVG